MGDGPAQVGALNPSENPPARAMPVAQFNLDNVEDFSTVCRTCATVTQLVIPIFQGEGLQNDLAAKINKHLPITVTEQDELPLVVCYQCASTVLGCHELEKSSREADKALRSRLNDIKKKSDAENNQNNKSQTSLIFYEQVKSVMVNYVDTIYMDDDLDMECVCQLCADHPSATSVQHLAEHLTTAHNEAVQDIKSIEEFIKDNITFEVALVSEDSDRYIESDTDDKSKDNLPSFLCPFCDSAFSSPTRLIFHLNQHIEICIDNAIECCDVTYNNKKAFVTHLQEKHVSHTPGDTGLHKCRSCAHVAEDAETLQRHINEHHIDHKRTCNKTTTEQSSKNQKFIPAVCPECNKTFSNKYNMFVHMKSHSNGKSIFQCDKCNKCYSNQWNLKNHKKQVHDGILNFVCSICGEAFPTRLACNVHARIHTGHKPYSCTVCKKSFRAKNTLDRHAEIHLNVRNYECHLCQKKFRKRSHLNYHLNTHKKTK